MEEQKKSISPPHFYLTGNHHSININLLLIICIHKGQGASTFLEPDVYSLLGSLCLPPCSTGSPLELAQSSSAHVALPQMFPAPHLLAGHLMTVIKPSILLMLYYKFWAKIFIICLFFMLFIKMNYQRTQHNTIICLFTGVI